jgi:DHA1 family inner membrane transport protein
VTLTAVSFIVGTTEFMAVGMVPQIAENLRAPVGSTGLISSLYATCVAVTTLPVAVALMQRSPRVLLPGGLAVFAGAHAVMALAPNLVVLIAGRVVAATIHSLALGSAFCTASVLAAPKQRGPAVAMVSGGLAAAMFLGAPLGTALGAVVGWRASFALVGGLGLLVALAVLRTVPRIPDQPSVDRAALRAALHPSVAKPLIAALVIQLANALMFTYLGAYLAAVTRLDGPGVAGGLAAFGLAGVLGTFLGGHAAGRHPRRWATLAGIAMAVSLAAFGFLGTHLGAAYLLIAIWGMAMQVIMPIVTHQAVESGGNLAAALNSGAANTGIATGGLAAGALLSLVSLGDLPWIASGATVLTVLIMKTNSLVNSPAGHQPSPH